MKLYRGVINLRGNILHQVRKDQLTAAEVALLRVLHGDDSVQGLEHYANVNRSDATERKRLAGIYTHRDANGVYPGEALVLKYLGAPGVPLPDNVELKIEEEEPEEVKALDEEVIEPIDRPVRTKVTAPKKIAESLMA